MKDKQRECLILVDSDDEDSDDDDLEARPHPAGQLQLWPPARRPLPRPQQLVPQLGPGRLLGATAGEQSGHGDRLGGI